MNERPPSPDSERGLPRFLARLVHLYPAAHRAEYGEEMLAAVRYRWRKGGGSFRDVVVLAGDLVAGAFGVWGDRLRRGTMGMGRGWLLDVRFVLRSLRRSAGYVATAVVVLACAVAANASVTSYVRGTLLKEAPWPDADRVMVVWGSNVREGQLRDVISGPTYIDVRDRATTLESMAAFRSDGAYLLVDGRPQVLDANEVSVEFFDVLGVEPGLGRFFDERDRTSSAAATIVVSHGFWRDRLDSDPDVVGTALSFEGDPRTIIGVLPEDFEFISPAPIFTPLRDDELAADSRSRIHYNVIARLAPGVAVSDANRDLNAVMADLVNEYPESEGWGLLVEPLLRVAVEGVRPVILTLAATVGLVLLVALVNLTTLFRIRAFTRGNELSVRAALGAGRLRLVRVLAMETVMIAAAGAVLGLVATPFILARLAAMVPVWIQVPDSAARLPVLLAELDPAVAVVAFGTAVAGALALTTPTLLSALGGIPLSVSGTRSVHPGLRGTRLLVGVELALATVLCIGAGLVARSTSELLSTDVGIEADELLTMYIADVWGLEADERTAYFREVIAEVERIPGVRRAGVMGYLDFQAEDDFARVYFLDGSLEPVGDLREEWRRVDEGLMEAAGMSMVAGRAFQADDFVGSPRVAVVNQAFADKHYPDGNAVGSFLSTHEEQYRDLRVIGVMRDVRSLGPTAPAPPMLYVPYQGAPRGTQGLYVRVAGDPMSYTAAVRDAVWSVDSSQPVYDVAPMTERVDMWIAIPRVTRVLVLGLAGLAWLLATLGVFGVVAYAVRTRRSELGIRLALGATPSRLEADQLRSVAPVVVMGLSAGLVLGIAAARGASAILPGVSPLDPFSLAGGLVVMGAAALAATWVPARRAGRIDPREVISTE